MTPEPPESTLITRLDGEAPEITVSLDILRRGAMAAPVIVAVCAVFAGLDGVFSSLYAIGLVLVNFLLAAALVAWTARISLGLMMGAVLFGYLVRLGLIFLAV
ncbi:MAG: ATP synthase subunit I, partial [Actinomycetota bacterium]